MVEHKCKTCFYAFADKKAFPCAACEGYNKYVNANVYSSDTQEIKMWDEEDAFVEKEYDVVSKPKHYMLFDRGFYPEGIEVRQVIEKLVYKVKMNSNPDWTSNSLFDSDYVQMMQYLMRFMDKNGKEDLEKARWYLDKLIEAYE